MICLCVSLYNPMKVLTARQNMNPELFLSTLSLLLSVRTPQVISLVIHNINVSYFIS